MVIIHIFGSNLVEIKSSAEYLTFPMFQPPHINIEAYSNKSKLFRPEELDFPTIVTQTPKQFKTPAKEKKLLFSHNPHYKKKIMPIKA